MAGRLPVRGMKSAEALSVWSNHGVIGDIEWPRRRATFRFGGYEILALPASRQHGASLHLDLHKARLDSVEAMSLFNEILSLATWFDDSAAVLLGGFSGSARPVPVDRDADGYLTSIMDAWPFGFDRIADLDLRRALAIYREAVNMERYHSLPYAALGYYRLLEIRFPKGHGRAAWIEATIQRMMVEDERPWWRERHHFDQVVGTTPNQMADYFYRQGRNAIAHAKDASINPDDVGELRALSVGLPLFRQLAREFIMSELDMRDDRWAGGGF